MPRVDGATRDRSCIEHMIRYCDQAEQALDEIGHSRERFMSSSTYQNDVAMCIFQLGELTKRLTGGFLRDHPQIPWNLIAKTRDTYAHHYGSVDFELVWETAVNDVPVLKAFCEEYIKR